MSVDPSSGTTATITGNRIVWNLGTLDANTRSRLAVRAIAERSTAGQASRTATIRAELTGQGISAGDAVATDSVTINSVEEAQRKVKAALTNVRHSPCVLRGSKKPG